MPRICDYEGSKYRTEFWGNQDRTYEDAVERIAMKKMLPPRGERLIEVGAGFGRLVDLYQGYNQIVLMDYARTQLEEAQKYLGYNARFIFVVADIYNMPFNDSLFDALTMVRVMHHLVNVPSALSEIHRIISANGTAVIEHANKLNLKAISRWLLGRQNWSPFDSGPIEFVELNFNFHPIWMRQQFEAAGLTVESCRTLSHYRVPMLKRTIPTSLLVALDSWAQLTGNWWQLSPSVFLQSRTQKSPQESSSQLFRCPNCKASMLVISEACSRNEYMLTCQKCHYGWQFKDGIFDFRTPARVPSAVT